MMDILAFPLLVPLLPPGKKKFNLVALPAWFPLTVESPPFSQSFFILCKWTYFLRQRHTLSLLQKEMMVQSTLLRCIRKASLNSLGAPDEPATPQFTDLSPHLLKIKLKSLWLFLRFDGQKAVSYKTGFLISLPHHCPKSCFLFSKKTEVISQNHRFSELQRAFVSQRKKGQKRWRTHSRSHVKAKGRTRVTTQDSWHPDFCFSFPSLAEKPYRPLPSLPHNIPGWGVPQYSGFLAQ